LHRSARQRSSGDGIMNKRFDIMTPRKGSGDKTFWTRIGTAWQSDKGIQLVFDALPLPDSEGRCVANLFEPRERDGGQQRQKPGNAGYSNEGAGSRFEQDLSDEIPF
jgi:hypothetical protein